MNIKIINLFLAAIIIICNIPLLIANFKIIKTDGGSMGIGLIALPILLFCNIFMIPAILTCFKKNRQNKFLLVLNIVGVICCLFFAFIIISTPKMD